MRQLLDSDLELLVESDFICLPLLLDPEIERETHDRFAHKNSRKDSGLPMPNAVVSHGDKYFIKSFSIASLIQHYDTINEYSYKQLEKSCLQKHQLRDGIDDIFLDDTLKLILFRVMPHFVRKRSGMQREKLDEDGMLKLIREKVNIPVDYYQDALKFIDLESLKDIHASLEGQKPIFKPLANGLMVANELRDWLHDVLQTKILTEEYDRVEKALQVRSQLVNKSPEYIALFLHIADKGHIEIDGFGLRRDKYPGEYLIYKRTGQYTLKDYYGRSYLFPDCRVAVSTAYKPLKPLVMEKYKHPFLRGYHAAQEICMRGIEAPRQLTAESLIQVLEDGITALLYGYEPRHRNGYHSLDKVFTYVAPAVSFEDYRV